MPSLVQLYTLSAQLCLIGATPVTSKRHDTTAVVHWSCNTGTPQHYAAGILNGIPDAANQIPDHFYTDIDLQYVRAGGAQVPAPGRGWIWGEGEYEVSEPFRSLFCADIRTALRRSCPTTALRGNTMQALYSCRMICGARTRRRTQRRPSPETTAIGRTTTSTSRVSSRT